MRFAALAALVVLIVAGAGYFAAKPKACDVVPHNVRAELHAEAVSDPADARDAELIRTSIGKADLTDEQSYTLVSAAGRRYMRRKLAYEEALKAAEQGRGNAAPAEKLKDEMDQARHICDLAESLGRHSREMILTATAGTELERLLWYGSSKATGLADKFFGAGTFTEADLDKMDAAFRERFGHPLPVSTRGASAVHRALGFDHRGRFDVAVVPENVEGIWVRNYLSSKNVTFFAFRSAVPGQATGAHIHIGPPSGRVHAD